MTTAAIEQLSFEPRAADFLELLRDLGHLDDAGVESVCSGLVSASRSEGVIRFDELRRAVAVYLFDHESKLRPEARDVLSLEWARLFS
jgi:hypothetical protein